MPILAFCTAEMAGDIATAECSSAAECSFAEDNTDVLLLGARDQLLGDVYFFLHRINIKHKYRFSARTFKPDSAAVPIDGEPGSHRQEVTEPPKISMTGSSIFKPGPGDRPFSSSTFIQHSKIKP